jgi:hypothetical protein|nr:hypothetical protein [uncultured Campylobacter sp.]
MENFQKPSQNVALAQTQSQAQPQERKPQAQPQSENAKLVQELKKLLRQIETLEKREKASQNALAKIKIELDKIAGEKARYAELLKKFDVVAV